MVGYSAWLLLPFTAYFILSFFPETNPIVLGFDFIFSLVELFLTFWIGIILILVVNSIIEKQLLDPSALKQKSIALFQPTANAFILQFLFIALGFVLLIIPGLIGLVWYAFTQTCVVLENKKGMQALHESKALSQGRFFRVAYRLIGGPIIIGIIYSIVVSLVLTFSGSLSSIQTMATQSSVSLPAWLDLLQSTVGIFTLPWLATYMVMLYKELQATRDPSTPLRSAQDDKTENISL